MVKRRDFLRGFAGAIAFGAGSTLTATRARGSQQGRRATWGTYGGSQTNTSNKTELPSATETPRQLANWNTASGNDVLDPSSIVVGDKHVYGVSDQLYALDKQTGEEVWRFDTGGRTKSTPAIADGTIYVPVPDNGNVFAVDVETGQRQWNRVVDGLAGQTSVTVADGTVIVLGQTTYGCYPCRQKAAVVALDAEDGELEWDTMVNDMNHDIPQRAPAVANGKVYITVRSGGLYAFDIESGEKSWLLGIGGETFTPPVIVDETILVTSGPRVHAVDLETYEEQWRFKTAGQIGTPPAAADGSVYVASGDGNLYALDLTNGQRDWNVPVTTNQYGLEFQKPCVAGDTVLVGNRKIHAFDTADGAELWTSTALVDESSLLLSRFVPGENRIYWSKGILTTEPPTPTPTQTPTLTTAAEPEDTTGPEPTSSSSAPGFGAAVGAASVGAVAGYLARREQQSE
ncbi:PQQ-binding-like beta-propeller repeat protein [Halobellus sp. H-GB7]|uniref:outer membrane protein assembly factor BamB family protein n=1 Tax=Halobellus sp. H-GB7 TaxID=3069756 RepID=UPI0027B05756|nr:PQQ-binding-like beta-propeller repeat protein [Halobellus sp. H-GB7]MDQ2055527.1 PQQ-binding-like beta-propeller repeat protein [Halobellus sp. H-GB7]